MKLKVINTGEGHLCRRPHTKVVNAETGEMVNGVQSVDFFVSIDGTSRAIITFNTIELEVQSDFEVKQSKKSLRRRLGDFFRSLRSIVNA